MYSIIRKRQVFYHLTNLPSTDAEIREILSKRSGSGSAHRRFEAPPHIEDDDDEEEEEEQLVVASSPLVEKKAPEVPPAPCQRDSDDVQKTSSTEANTVRVKAFK